MISPALRDRLHVLSFVLIVLVVFAHARDLRAPHAADCAVAWRELPTTVLFLQEAVSLQFCRVAVPLFFLISGYLFFRSYEQSAQFFVPKFKRRFHTLLTPYLIWSAISLVIIIVLQQTGAIGDFRGDAPVLDMAPRQWLTYLTANPVAYPLWFVRHLLVIIVFTPLLAPLLRRAGVPLLLVFLALWLTRENPLHVRSRALLFFSAGAYLQIHRVDIERPVKARFAFLLGWLGLVFTDAYFRAFKNVEHPGLHEVGVLLGVAAVWGYSDKLAALFERLRLQWILAAGFFIFVAHEPMEALLRELALPRLLGVSTPALVLRYFAAPLITLAVCVMLSLGLRKAAPKAYALLTGGR